jgi:hypothetical protein
MAWTGANSLLTPLTEFTLEILITPTQDFSLSVYVVPSLVFITIFIFITEIRKTSGKLLRKLVNNWLIIKHYIIQMHYRVMNVLD